MNSGLPASEGRSHTEQLPAIRLRPFNLGDGMIFIAATALALPFALWALERILERILEWDRTYPLGVSHDLRAFSGTLWWGFWNRSGQGYNIINFATQGLLVLVASWSLAIPLVRLRKPRPPTVEALVQPGAVVGLVILLNLWGYLTLAGFQILPPPQVLVSTWGGGVAVAWVLLAITRRWKPEASWIDRLGRGLGVCWVGSVPLMWWLGGC
jgi:hypothetical protein